jgi:hypothetical protein
VQSADFMCRSDYWCNAGVAQIFALAQALRKYSRLHKNYKVCTKNYRELRTRRPAP